MLDRDLSYSLAQISFHVACLRNYRHIARLLDQCLQPGRDFERRRPHGHGAGGPGRQPDRDHRRAQPRLSQERDLEKITMKTTHSLVTLILCLAPLALAQTPTPAP